jgi:hypothetical protein
MPLLFVVLFMVVNSVVARSITVYTFVPGVGGAVLILVIMYAKWWRDGRLG